MSSNSRAKTHISTWDKIQKNNRNVQEIYSLFRTIEGPKAGTSPIFGTGRNGNFQGDWLRNPDVTLTGIYSIFPKVLSMTSTTIDISRDQDPDVFTSRLILANSGAFDLENIAGAAHAGQYLEIQGVVTETILIKNGTGNIRTQTGADIQITDNQIVTLRFDSIANEWVVVTGSSGGDNLGNHIAIQDLLPDSSDVWDLGDSTFYWSQLHVKEIAMHGNATEPDSVAPTGIRKTSQGMTLHVDADTDIFKFRFNGTTHLTVSQNQLDLANDLTIENAMGLILSDFTTDPIQNGEFRRNGNDVKVYTGGILVNLTDVGDAANKTLSNLTVPTSINQDLIPNGAGTRDIGSSLNYWQLIKMEQLSFFGSRSDPNSASPTSIRTLASGSMAFNLDDGSDHYSFWFDGTAVWSISSSSLTGENIILNQSLILNDSTTDPIANGEFSRNGNDVKVYSGGAVRNLSEVGEIFTWSADHDANGHALLQGRIADPTTPTKQLKFDLSGASASTNTTLTFAQTLNSVITFPSISAGTIPYLERNQTWSGLNTFTPGATLAGFNVGSRNGAPSAPANGDAYYDTGLGQWQFREAGSWQSLGGGTTSFADNDFDIHDESVTTKKLEFNLGSMVSGTHFISAITTAARTWTLPDITGELASLVGSQTFSGTKTFSQTIIANASTGINLNGHTISNVGTLDGASSGSIVNSTAGWTFDVDSGDIHDFKIFGTRILRIGDSDIEVSDGIYFRAESSGVIGYFVNHVTTGLGNYGSVQIPYNSGSVGSAANANNDFGNNDGCIGIYGNSGGNPTLVCRVASNKWIAITVTSSAISGGHLT